MVLQEIRELGLLVSIVNRPFVAFSRPEEALMTFHQESAFASALFISKLKPEVLSNGRVFCENMFRSKPAAISAIATEHAVDTVSAVFAEIEYRSHLLYIDGLKVCPSY